MTNESIYRKEINTNEDYKISKKEFEKWLRDENKLGVFTVDLYDAMMSDDMYTVAVDYSIPIIMVKIIIKSWF